MKPPQEPSINTRKTSDRMSLLFWHRTCTHEMPAGLRPRQTPRCSKEETEKVQQNLSKDLT